MMFDPYYGVHFKNINIYMVHEKPEEFDFDLHAGLGNPYIYSSKFHELRYYLSTGPNGNNYRSQRVLNESGPYNHDFFYIDSNFSF